jgi:hypothetical protein
MAHQVPKIGTNCRFCPVIRNATSLKLDTHVRVAVSLPYASPSRYETALANLGSYLGFDADRPEQIHGVGPDVLWRTDAPFDLVVEAKNEKQDENPLYKKDHAQLLEAEHWFRGAYPGRESVRVSALPEPIADQKATPKGTFALRLADATRLAGAVREMLTELVALPGEEAALRERCEALLAQLPAPSRKLPPAALPRGGEGPSSSPQASGACIGPAAQRAATQPNRSRKDWRSSAPGRPSARSSARS